MLLLPAALASLLALLIPLAIHLARRSEATPIDFAALQWLRQKPRPKSRLRFDEWPLLIARLLLLALIALWLARPVLPNSADTRPVVAALPGVDAGEPAPNARNIWLAPGFPSYDEPQDSCLTSPLPSRERSRDGEAGPGEGEPPCPNPMSLIRQLDSELAPGVPLTIIVPAILQGIDAERPRLSRPVTWQIALGAMPAIMPATMPATTATPPKPLTFTLRGPASHPLRAAISALDTPGKPTNFSVSAPAAPLPALSTVMVWFTPGPLPAPVRDWIAAGGTALVTSATPAEPTPRIPMWRDATGAALVEAQSIGQGRLFRFTRPLTAAAVPDLLEPDFPQKLAALFTPPPKPPARIAAKDIAPTTGALPWPQPARDLQPWLALIIAALFIAERWLATRRNRAVAP